MTGEERVVVAGAGAAGLAVAAVLEQRGITPLVVEREQEIGLAWERRYESLRLNTPRLLSDLPRYRMPRSYGRWPARRDVAEYLREYRRRLGLRVELGTEVRGVDREDGRWLVRTSKGDLRAGCVVITTGHDAHPVIPDWPGRESFPGELIHSSAYREPSPFRGKDVLVVSAANSGSEIAYELARGGAGRVRTAMRTPPAVVPREYLGLPLMYGGLLFNRWPDWVGDLATQRTQRRIYGDLSAYGLPRAPYGVQTSARRRHRSPLVDGGFVDALKAGEIEVVAAVEAFEGAAVVLADGSRVQPDVVIAATGYRGNLPELVGHLGVLDDRGWPAVEQGSDHPQAPGLFFSGYWASMIGQLVHMRRDARRIARAIARRLTR
jgi:putative flavoprotein involved in K+ transport